MGPLQGTVAASQQGRGRAPKQATAFIFFLFFFEAGFIFFVDVRYSIRLTRDPVGLC
jgi:hypothetical protein